MSFFCSAVMVSTSVGRIALMLVISNRLAWADAAAGRARLTSARVIRRVNVMTCATPFIARRMVAGDDDMRSHLRDEEIRSQKGGFRRHGDRLARPRSHR